MNGEVSGSSVEILEAGLREIGIDFTDAQLQGLLKYEREIDFWNSSGARKKRGIGLVRASGKELIVRHFLDSLAVLPVLRGAESESILDAGAGAGFPGIPLSFFLPTVRIVLLDRSGRKAAFLRNAVSVLGLSHVSVKEGSLESLRGSFNIILFRALGTLGDIVPLCLPLLGRPGKIIAYKGRKSSVLQELGGIEHLVPLKCIRVMPLSVPFLDEERYLVIIEHSGNNRG